MIPEISHIIETHRLIRQGKRGPDNHKSILRGSVLLLCAAWEIYCERVVLESALKISKSAKRYSDLPEAAITQLKIAVHNENVFKSEPLRLAGNGWRIEYVKVVRDKCQALNTPKSANLDLLFKQCIGLKDLSKSWNYGKDEIDSFVRIRGEIAHRGSDSLALNRDDVSHFKAVVQKSISDTDDLLYDYLKGLPFYKKAPWQKTSK
ncbi:HEPN domain-containing protein [Roseinatronobacter sp.]|uniref:HEPN domain-containing protein n=1 Tax=Roseinatronobacter sp. TaxID=1945755 RepID=UPI0025D77725|nr:HEPN domain-containing protein [Roseibaca sp.]